MLFTSFFVNVLLLLFIRKEETIQLSSFVVSSLADYVACTLLLSVNPVKMQPTSTTFAINSVLVFQDFDRNVLSGSSKRDQCGYFLNLPIRLETRQDPLSSFRIFFTIRVFHTPQEVIYQLPPCEAVLELLNLVPKTRMVFSSFSHSRLIPIRGYISFSARGKILHKLCLREPTSSYTDFIISVDRVNGTHMINDYDGACPSKLSPMQQPLPHMTCLLPRRAHPSTIPT